MLKPTKSDTPPVIQPPVPLPAGLKLKASKTASDELLQMLSEKLEVLKVAKDKGRSHSVNMMSNAGHNLERLLEASPSASVNKLKWGKVPNQPYYHRPSPIDTQFENKNVYDGVGFTGESLQEWNLDGLADYQVLVLLKHMTMFAQALRTRGNTEQDITLAITSGFSGTLGLWWDNLMTEEDKRIILTSRRESVNPQTQEVVHNDDSVITLMYTILRHFVGNSQDIIARSYDQLSNLKCKSMAEFKYYKDTFLSKVMCRNDCNGDYWKEKFVEGLPPLFSQRVKTRLKAKHDGTIP